MEKYINLQRNIQLNPQDKDEEPKQFIERLKKKHKDNQEFKDLFKEAKLEALGVNLTFYDKFYCPDSNRNVKDLSQLYALTKHLNKTLQKEALVDDVIK